MAECAELRNANTQKTEHLECVLKDLAEKDVQESSTQTDEALM